MDTETRTMPLFNSIYRKTDVKDMFDSKKDFWHRLHIQYMVSKLLWGILEIKLRPALVVGFRMVESY